MPHPSHATPPKDDSEYLERMSKTVFTAGLNWSVVDRKWPNFRKAFSSFSPEKVSKLTSKDIRGLMSNDGIVRNEKKIVATVSNAKEFLAIKKDYGSFKGYLDSMGEDEEKLQADLQRRFEHVGPSTARMFLWSVGHKLTPNAQEKRRMSKNTE
jgi:DNA-3-methyladenine glycosylase I